MGKKDLKINRFIAKGIDFFIAVFILVSFIYFGAPNLGLFGAVMFMLISDGFFDGQSIGKKLVGLKVVVFRGEELQKCTFKNSAIRNSILIPILFSQIFIIGILLLMLGGLIIAIESYFSYSDEQGRRIGDVLSGTMVLEVSEKTLPPQ